MKFRCSLVVGFSLLFCFSGVVGAETNTGLLSKIQRASDAGPTVITSDRLEFDYKEYVARFEDNVVVTDPDFSLEAKIMVVYFDSTNDIKKVIAAENVVMRRGEMFAVCDKATYTRATGQVLLEGGPPVVTQGENRITGDKIAVWPNEERVVVLGGVKLEAQSDSLKK